MVDLAPVLERCVLCQHPLVDQINKRIREQTVAETMRWMASIDLDVPHRNTFSHHKRQHMMAEFERQREAAAKRLSESRKQIKGKAGDLAALVRDNVFARVEAGELDPTLSEGLRAQAMIDARNERGADRDLMIQLAGLLSGATAPVALLADGTTIDGEFREVGEREEDEAAFAALIPE